MQIADSDRLHFSIVKKNYKKKIKLFQAFDKLPTVMMMRVLMAVMKDDCPVGVNTQYVDQLVENTQEVVQLQIHNTLRVAAAV